MSSPRPGPAPIVPAGAAERFLRAIFGPATANAYITAFREDPTGQHSLAVRGRMWSGGTYAALRSTLTPDANQYCCVSTFNASRDPADRGRPRRQRALFAACYAIMIDDIGTKVKEDAIKLRPFTALVETSPGNFQGWYALDPAVDEPDDVDHVVDEMIRLGLAKVDPGMKGVTRYGRLPAGVNNKGKLKTPFPVRLAELHDVRYALADIAQAYGIGPRPEPEPAPYTVHIDDVARERYASGLIEALVKAKCEPREHPNKPGGFDVLCPWRDEHTNGDTSGSMLFIPGYVDPSTRIEYTLGGYKCHHGHCESKRLRDVLQWLNSVHGAELKHPAWLQFPPAPPERLIPAESGLIVGEDSGVPKRTMSNAEIILRFDPFYARSGAFRLAWDKFNNETHVSFEGDTVNAVIHDRYPGRGVPPDLSSSVIMDLYRVHGVEFLPGPIERVLSVVVLRNTFDSAHEWAMQNASRWDGVPRIERWMIDFCGAADTEFVRTVSRLFMLAIAKRAMSPGFKFDNMLILEGEQGIGKSTFLRELAPRPEWYASTHFDVQNKDAISESMGKLIVEFEELQSLRRSDYPAMKGFLSRTSDRVRLPYERMAADYPRRTVYVGTTNDATYLVDTTGNRRFWPVRLADRRIDIQALREVKDQMWAESCARAAKLDKLELPEKLVKHLKVETENRMSADPWQEAIQEFTEELAGHNGGFMRMNEVLSRVGVPTANQTRAHEMRAGIILRALGYERVKKRWSKGQPPAWAWTIEV